MQVDLVLGMGARALMMPSIHINLLSKAMELRWLAKGSSPRPYSRMLRLTVGAKTYKG